MHHVWIGIKDEVPSVFGKLHIKLVKVVDEMTFAVGEIISYLDMCAAEGTQLQRGMNFRLKSGRTVVLMSRRSNAPYTDAISSDGKVITYEGHDATSGEADIPKMVDQPSNTFKGTLTQNGLFYEAAMETKSSRRPPELVQVYEKLFPGTWVFNGAFHLMNAYQEHDGNRNVFKFVLQLSEKTSGDKEISPDPERPTDRVIPSDVKREVWKRDGGKCVLCGKTDNLHFDHDLPYSLGGTSILVENIQLLCAFHNLSKSNRIQ